MRIAVIGAGVAGAAAALALARSGARVTLFDQYAPGHDRGSSHGATRLFRTAYFEHPDYVPILQRALAGWKALNAETGERVFIQSGVIEAGPADGFLMPGLDAAIARHSLPVDRLTRAALKKDHPALSIPDAFEAIFERDAGFILADKALAAMLRLAEAAGATLRAETRVARWSPAKVGVAVETPTGAEIFDRLIIAAGSWADALIGLEAAHVALVEKTLFWRKPETNAFTLEAGFAPFGVETEDGAFFYGFPAIDRDGVKIAEHTKRETIRDHGERTAQPAQGEEDAIDAFLARFCPALAGRRGKFQRCLYEMSADGDFLIDRHPGCDRVIFAAGLSGHGFKFAPALGEALRHMALEDETPAEWAFLSLKRFSQTP